MARINQSQAATRPDQGPGQEPPDDETVGSIKRQLAAIAKVGLPEDWAKLALGHPAITRVGVYRYKGIGHQSEHLTDLYPGFETDLENSTLEQSMRERYGEFAGRLTAYGANPRGGEIIVSHRALTVGDPKPRKAGGADPSDLNATLKESVEQLTAASVIRKMATPDVPESPLSKSTAEAVSALVGSAVKVTEAAGKDSIGMKDLIPLLKPDDGIRTLLPTLVQAALQRPGVDPLVTQVLTAKLAEDPVARTLELVRLLKDEQGPPPERESPREVVRDLLSLAADLGLRRGGAADTTPPWVTALSAAFEHLGPTLTEGLRTLQVALAARSGMPIPAPAGIPPSAGPSVPPPATGIEAVQAFVAHAAAIDPEGIMYGRLAEMIRTQVPQGGQFLHALRTGQIPTPQALTQMHNAGLVPPGTDAWVLQFFRWVRAGGIVTTPSAPEAPPAPPTAADTNRDGSATVAPGEIVARCDACGAEFILPSRVELDAVGDLRCGESTPTGPCPGRVQAVAP